MVKYFFICTVCVLCSVFALLYYQNMNSKTNVDFFDEARTKHFLMNDEDKYVKSLTKYDLIARKSEDTKSYLMKISECVSSFQDAEKKKLIKCSKLADRFLKNFKWNNLDCNEISILPWKFALTSKTNNFEYEDGLPHTRKDIIFLTRNNLVSHDENLVNILIHEKVHIYQRMNKSKMNKIVNEMGFVVFTKTTELNLKLKRSNPDIDNEIYYDKQKGIINLCKYSSENPSNISDVESNNMSSEHPYEKMAYEIAGEYSRRVLNEKKI